MFTAPFKDFKNLPTLPVDDGKKGCVGICIAISAVCLLFYSIHPHPGESVCFALVYENMQIVLEPVAIPAQYCVQF